MRIVLIPTAQTLSARCVTAPGPAAVIDALRATTTTVAALWGGAAAVEPVAGVAASRRRRRALGERALLAGERHGHALPGFDLGNSPLDAERRATGRVLVLTTTNGTLACARLAMQGAGTPERPVYAAALPNLSRVVERLLQDAAAPTAEAVTLVCAGQSGHSAAEDMLVAGAIASRLPAAWERDDLAQCAEWAWRATEDRRADSLAACPHGRTLVGQGYGADIAYAARVDSAPCLPVLRVEAGAPPYFTRDDA